MKIGFICLSVCIAIPVFAQDNGAQHIKKGNDLFKKGSLPEAIAEYDKATSGTNKYVALVNKGDALFRLKKYDEALKSYQQANEAGNTDAGLRSGAFYNAGVVYSNQNKLDESIEAYKNALRLNSNDVNARENLQKALLEKKKQSGGGGGGGKDKNDQSQQQKSKLSQSQSQNKLDKLEEKEKNTQERISENKSQYGTSNAKDW
ncbi:MAG: tetratricopeptide repeat protein [Niabella sp.]|nr:tetratricopeptide repeat protein [Niabella sp.]